MRILLRSLGTLCELFTNATLLPRLAGVVEVIEAFHAACQTVHSDGLVRII